MSLLALAHTTTCWVAGRMKSVIYILLTLQVLLKPCSSVRLPPMALPLQHQCFLWFQIPGCSISTYRNLSPASFLTLPRVQGQCLFTIDWLIIPISPLYNESNLSKTVAPTFFSVACLTNNAWAFWTLELGSWILEYCSLMHRPVLSTPWASRNTCAPNSWFKISPNSPFILLAIKYEAKCIRPSVV